MGESINGRSSASERKRFSGVLRAVTQRLWVILLGALAVALLVALHVRSEQGDMYSATVTLAVSSRDTGELSVTSGMARGVANLLNSGFMQGRVCRALELPASRAGITAGVVGDTNLVTLQTTSDTSQDAFRVMDRVLEELPVLAVYVAGESVVEALREPGASAAADRSAAVTRQAAPAFLLTAAALFLLLARGSRRKGSAGNGDVSNTPAGRERIDLLAPLRELLPALCRLWWLVLLLTAAFSALFCLRTAGGDASGFAAEATVSVRDANGVASERTAAVLPDVFTSSALSEVIAEELGGGSVPGIIRASNIQGTCLLTVTVRSAREEDARAVLRALLESYPAVARYVVGETELETVYGGTAGDGGSAAGLRGAALMGALAGFAAGVAALALYAYVLRGRKGRDAGEYDVETL